MIMTFWHVVLFFPAFDIWGKLCDEVEPALPGPVPPRQQGSAWSTPPTCSPDPLFGPAPGGHPALPASALGPPRRLRRARLTPWTLPRFSAAAETLVQMPALTFPSCLSSVAWPKPGFPRGSVWWPLSGTPEYNKLCFPEPLLCHLSWPHLSGHHIEGHSHKYLLKAHVVGTERPSCTCKDWAYLMMTLPTWWRRGGRRGRSCADREGDARRGLAQSWTGSFLSVSRSPGGCPRPRFGRWRLGRVPLCMLQSQQGPYEVRLARTPILRTSSSWVPTQVPTLRHPSAASP